MNTLVRPLHLVNTYGAFGTVGRERDEIVLRGHRRDADPGPTRAGARTSSRASRATPRARPCVVVAVPLPPRLADLVRRDVELDRDPWLCAPGVEAPARRSRRAALLATDPFPDAPKWLRAELFEYKLTTFKDRDAGWWTRRRIETYLPPVSLDTVELREFIAGQGWPVAPPSLAPAKDGSDYGRETLAVVEPPLVTVIIWVAGVRPVLVMRSS